MIWLILSILTSTILFIVFKFIAKNKVKALQAIVINYTVCVIEGAIVEGHSHSVHEITSASWFLPALLLGSLFISVFYLTAMTVKYNGVAVASIASKLSLVIPTIAAYYLYNDVFTAGKVAGILMAMVAVVFTTYRKEEREGETVQKVGYFLPLMILIGGGIIDATTKYNQEKYVGTTDYNLFLICVFGTAAILGWLILGYRYFAKSERVEKKSVVHGILLGIPNYGTMFFLLKALSEPDWDSSTFFPINNIGIVLTCCLCAWLLFNEKLSRLNLLGIGLAVCSILLIMYI